MLTKLQLLFGPQQHSKVRCSVPKTVNILTAQQTKCCQCTVHPHNVVPQTKRKSRASGKCSVQSRAKLCKKFTSAFLPVQMRNLFSRACIITFATNSMHTLADSLWTDSINPSRFRWECTLPKLSYNEAPSFMISVYKQIIILKVIHRSCMLCSYAMVTSPNPADNVMQDLDTNQTFGCRILRRICWRDRLMRPRSFKCWNF